MPTYTINIDSLDISAPSTEEAVNKLFSGIRDLMENKKNIFHFGRGNIRITDFLDTNINESYNKIEITKGINIYFSTNSKTIFRTYIDSIQDKHFLVSRKTDFSFLLNKKITIHYLPDATTQRRSMTGILKKITNNYFSINEENTKENIRISIRNIVNIFVSSRSLILYSAEPYNDNKINSTVEKKELENKLKRYCENGYLVFLDEKDPFTYQKYLIHEDMSEDLNSLMTWEVEE